VKKREKKNFRKPKKYTKRRDSDQREQKRRHIAPVRSMMITTHRSRAAFPLLL